jgi:hypothetical protein
MAVCSEDAPCIASLSDTAYMYPATKINLSLKIA